MEESILSMILVQVEILLGVAVLLGVVAFGARIFSRMQRTRRRLRRRKENGSQIEATAEPQAGPQTTAALTTLRPDLSSQNVGPVVPVRACPVPVLAPGEISTFRQLQRVVDEVGAGHRVLPRQSLSSFLFVERDPTGRPGSRARQTADTQVLASLEVDFLIVDADWRPVAAFALTSDDAQDAARTRSSGEDTCTDTTANVQARRESVEAAICRQADVAFLEFPAAGITGSRHKALVEFLESLDQIAAQ